MAEVHVSQNEQERFESPHLHLDSHSDGVEESGHVDSPDHDSAEHHKNSHVHCHCDFSDAAVFDAESSQELAIQHPAYQASYLGLNYKPAVPPPNV